MFPPIPKDCVLKGWGPGPCLGMLTLSTRAPVNSMPLSHLTHLGHRHDAEGSLRLPQTQV